MTQLLTITEAAARLSVSRDTVDRMVKDGRLEVVNIGDPQATRRTLRVPAAAVERLATNRA